MYSITLKRRKKWKAMRLKLQTFEKKAAAVTRATKFAKIHI